MRDWAVTEQAHRAQKQVMQANGRADMDPCGWYIHGFRKGSPGGLGGQGPML